MVAPTTVQNAESDSKKRTHRDARGCPVGQYLAAMRHIVRKLGHGKRTDAIQGEYLRYSAVLTCEVRNGYFLNI